jgi:predicted transcriptional regulator
MPNYDKNMEYISHTQTLIGTQRKRLLDQDTGEVIEVDQITKRALGQKAFWKVYLMDFLQILGGFEYKQLDVLIHVLESTDASTNTFFGTYRGIANKIGVSYDTVQRTIKLLLEKSFIKRIQTGVYQVSPNIMMKGNDNKKQILLNYYRDTEPPQPGEQISMTETERGESENDEDGNSNERGRYHDRLAV